MRIKKDNFINILILITSLIVICTKLLANDTCTSCGKSQQLCNCPKAEACGTEVALLEPLHNVQSSDLGMGFYPSVHDHLSPSSNLLSIGLLLKPEQDPIDGYLSAMGVIEMPAHQPNETNEIDNNFVFAIQDTDIIQGDRQTIEFLESSVYNGSPTIDVSHEFTHSQDPDLGTQIRQWIQNNLRLETNSYHFICFQTNDFSVVKYGIFISEKGEIYFISRSRKLLFPNSGFLCIHLHAMFHRFKIRQIRYNAKVFKRLHSKPN